MKYAKLFVIIMILSVLSGCIPVNLKEEIVITPSGGGSYSGVVFINKKAAMLIGLNEDKIKQDLNSKLPSYATGDCREENGNIYTDINFSFDSIKDFKNKISCLSETTPEITLKQDNTFFKSYYYLEITCNTDYGELLLDNHTLYIQMPGEITESNGIKVMENKIRFDLNGLPDTMWARSEVYNVSTIFPLVVFSLVFILFLILIVRKFVNNVL